MCSLAGLALPFELATSRLWPNFWLAECSLLGERDELFFWSCRVGLARIWRLLWSKARLQVMPATSREV